MDRCSRERLWHSEKMERGGGSSRASTDNLVDGVFSILSASSFFLAFRLCLHFMGGGIFSFFPFPCGSDDLDGWVGGWEEDLIDSIHLSR